MSCSVPCMWPVLITPSPPCCQELEMKLVQAKLDQALHLNTQLELKSQVGCAAGRGRAAGMGDAGT